MSVISKLMQVAVALLCLGAAGFILRDHGLPASASRAREAGQGRAPEVESRAPSFTLESHRSETFMLRPSTSATVLNFWASWCQPCRAEMMELQELVDSQPDSPRVIAVNLGETITSVENWVADLGLAYSVLLDPQLAVASLYGIRGLPTTYLLDSQLTIKEIYFGPVSAAALRRSIDGLANQT